MQGPTLFQRRLKLKLKRRPPLCVGPQPNDVPNWHLPIHRYGYSNTIKAGVASTSRRRGKQPSSKSRWLLQMSSISIPLRIPKPGFVSRRISNPFRFALFWSTPRGQVRSVRLMPHHLQRESGKSEKRESDANYPTSTRRASQVNRLRLSPPSDVVCGPVPSLIWPNGCQDECQRKVDSASFLICWMNPFVGCMLIIF